MSIRSAPSDEVATRILTALDHANLSVLRLATITGIPRGTLDRHLKVTPRFLTLGEIEDVATALGIEYEALLLPTVLAA